MAYSTPATFADGDILSAAQLNVLGANQEYFKGIVDAPNVPFVATRATSDTTAYYWFRHREGKNYFHWKFAISSGECDALKIRIYAKGDALEYGGPIFEEPGNVTVEQPDWESSYDIGGLTVGNWYYAEVELKFTGTGIMWLINLSSEVSA